MRRLLTFLLLVLAACVYAQEAPSKEKQSLEWSEITNNDGCYRVSFPTSWSVSLIGSDGDDVQAISPAEDAGDLHFENVVIWVEPLAEAYSSTQYYQLSIKNLESRSRSFTLLDEGQRKVDGREARWFHAKLQQGGVWGEILQVQILFNGRVYILDCTAEPGKMEQYLPLFHQIIDSFQIDCG